MNKKAVIAIGAVVVAIALFAGGAVAGPSLLQRTGIGVIPAGPGGAGGPMANLTDEERAQVQNMSDSERQAFFQEKFGSAPVTGGMRGGRGPGAQVIEGEIADVAVDQLTVKTTSGGSQVVYYDTDTVIAVVKGGTTTQPAVGGTVSVVAAPEADNVLAASIIVLK